MNNYRKRICIIATVPFALNVFMQPHILMLAEQYEVTLISSSGGADLAQFSHPHIKFIQVSIFRRISILNDVVTLLSLWRIFRTQQFDVVHSIMPKSGLLAMVGARLAAVPHRVHTFTGQVWANKSGISRFILKLMDKITATCATDLLADSFSQRAYLIEQNIVVSNKVVVLGDGSVCGVDIERFKPNAAIRDQLRATLNVSNDAVVFVFLGRVNQDKGVQDLVQAFVAVNQLISNSYLLVVGPDEAELNVTLQEIATPCGPHYCRIGYTDRPEDFMACADIFCLPSYREGFGSVIIEAASVGLPAVASRIYGLVDAVVDGKTGILHEAKNIRQIQDAMLLLANDSDLRRAMARQAKQRAHEMFNQIRVKHAMRDFYQQLLR